MFLRMSKEEAMRQEHIMRIAIDVFAVRIKKGRRKFIMLKTVDKIKDEMEKEIIAEVENAIIWD